jgi:hypothetical protein
MQKTGTEYAKMSTGRGNTAGNLAANLTNTTYLDVFSCKAYDPKIVRGFSQSYFGGSLSNLTVDSRH